MMENGNGLRGGCVYSVGRERRSRLGSRASSIVPFMALICRFNLRFRMIRGCCLCAKYSIKVDLAGKRKCASHGPYIFSFVRRRFRSPSPQN
jgi:hypothetical protein